MEEQSLQKISAESAENPCGAATGREPSEKHPVDVRRGKQKGFRWPVWLLVILILLLLASSVANLVVSQRAYESSRKQGKAIEQLTQSIKDIQKSVDNLSKMVEPPPQEEDEPEEESGLPTGDGSI